ncbi:pantoate--beta-alanine ligase [Lentisphaerota bacterium WC36G]|nr:pantoate--beta-alanine ligase [Lentisphaerae bacterium WC36]
MKIISTISEMQNASQEARMAGLRIAVVPTMGCLHEGHISLIEKAKQLANFVIVTIFVNPTQFGENEDFSTYPRTFDRDCQICKDLTVDVIFAPQDNEMYHSDASTWVEEIQLSENLCGKTRKGHFRGVTTVVAKLFNATMPHKAIFGQKDAQQALIIKRMIRDLNFPVEMIIAPTIRENDGLAMSSRNKYLSEKERKTAPIINQLLIEIEEKLLNEQAISVESLKEYFTSSITAVGGKVDYIEIVDANNLKNITDKQLDDITNTEILIATAVYMNTTRLIDNQLILHNDVS